MRRFAVAVLATLTLAAAPIPASVSVDDAVYGGTTTGTTDATSRKGEPVYALVRCYIPEFVYAQYAAVSAGTFTLGPFGAIGWPSGPASCDVEVGYYTRAGFGRWVITAETTFAVT